MRENDPVRPRPGIRLGPATIRSLSGETLATDVEVTINVDTSAFDAAMRECMESAAALLPSRTGSMRRPIEDAAAASGLSLAAVADSMAQVLNAYAITGSLSGIAGGNYQYGEDDEAFDLDPGACWKCDAKPGMDDLDGACWHCWYDLTGKRER